MEDFPLPPVTDELLRLFRFGLRISTISEKTGIPINKLEAMHRRGLVIKPRNTKIRYYCNYDFFEKIDTEEKAYWLGFLYADGCIVEGKGVNLLLAGYERPHLEKYKRSLESDHPIEERYDTIRDKNRPERIQHNVKVRINSLKMLEDLKDKGCLPRKSMSLRFPSKSQVPDCLIRHFIRGYFDGDGSVWNIEGTNKWGVSIIGAGEFVHQMMGKMMSTGLFVVGDFSFRNHSNFAKNGMVYLSLCSFGAMNRFKNYIYDDSSVRLDRKFEKFGQMPPEHEFRKLAMEEALAVLKHSQETMTTDNILSAVRIKYPAMKLDTIQFALKAFKDSGLVLCLGKDGKNGHFKYQYDFSTE